MSRSPNSANRNSAPNDSHAREMKPMPLTPTAVTCDLPRATQSIAFALKKLTAKSPTPNAQPPSGKPPMQEHRQGEQAEQERQVLEGRGPCVACSAVDGRAHCLMNLT